jgi:nitroreductase
METLNAIMSRRSIRALKAEPIPEESLEVIVRAAAAAPIVAMLFDKTIKNLDQTICYVITRGNLSQTLIQKVAVCEALS